MEGRLAIVAASLFALLPNAFSLIINLNANRQFKEEFKKVFYNFKGVYRRPTDNNKWIELQNRLSMDLNTKLAVSFKNDEFADARSSCLKKQISSCNSQCIVRLQELIFFYN